MDDRTRKVLRGLDEMFGNVNCLLKQLPDSRKLREATGDCLAAVHLFCDEAQVSDAERRDYAQYVSDALNAIRHMNEMAETFRAAKQSVGVLMDRVRERRSG